MKRVALDKFHNLKIKVQYEEIMKKYADKCRRILNDTSPSSGRPNRATPYSLGWDVRENPNVREYCIQVWNKTNWQLTHLLENGHFVTNLHSGLAWVAPRKHILPAYLDVKNPYINAMKHAKVDIDIK